MIFIKGRVQVKTNNQLFLQGDNSKAVLLMHGLTSGAAQMIPMAHYLNDYGYSVSCVNIAGHGTYPEDLLHTNAEDMILKAVYDYENLKKEYENVFVGGISTGGLLAMMLGSIYPQIKGIVSISAPVRLVPGTFISKEYEDRSQNLIRPLEGKVGIFKKYHIHYEKIAVCIFDELRRLMDIVNNSETLGKAKSPTLLVHAADDDIAEPGSEDILASMLGSSKIEIFKPQTGGHLSILSDGREVVFRRTVDFLNAIE